MTVLLSGAGWRYCWSGSAATDEEGITVDSSGGCRLIGGLARGEVTTAGDGSAGDVRAEAATTGDARGSIPNAGMEHAS